MSSSNIGISVAFAEADINYPGRKCRNVSELERCRRWKAGEGYAVICDALRKTGKAGPGQVTIGGRERRVAIAPLEDAS